MDGMDDESIIPDEAITLEPAGADPSDIRPGNTWVTNGVDPRSATINIGDTLKNGGTVKLVDNDNVANYVVETITPTGLDFVKVNNRFVFFQSSNVKFLNIILDTLWTFSMFLYL